MYILQYHYSSEINTLYKNTKYMGSFNAHLSLALNSDYASYQPSR